MLSVGFHKVSIPCEILLLKIILWATTPAFVFLLKNGIMLSALARRSLMLISASSYPPPDHHIQGSPVSGSSIHHHIRSGVRSSCSGIGSPSYKTALKAIHAPSLYLKGTGIRSMAAMTVIGIQTFLFILAASFPGPYSAPVFIVFSWQKFFMTAGGCQTSVSSAGI